MPNISSVSQSCPTVWDPMDCSIPGFPVFYQLPELAQTHVHRVSDTTEPSHPLSSPSPSTFNLSQHQGLLQWVSSSHQRPKYWSFSFSISPSNEYSGLISFRMDWLDLLPAQGTKANISYGINIRTNNICFQSKLLILKYILFMSQNKKTRWSKSPLSICNNFF